MRTRNFSMPIPILILTVVAGLAGILLSRGSQAQAPLSNVKDETLIRLGLRAGGFLDEIANDNVDDGVDQFLVRSPLLKDAPRVAKLKESIRRTMQQYGRFLKVEQIQQEKVGRSLVRAVYLYACEEYPVVWSFTFYRPDEEGEWTVISMQFNVDYDRLPAAH